MTAVKEAGSFDEALDRCEEFRSDLDADNHLVIRGVVPRELVIEARRTLRAGFDPGRDLRETPNEAFPMRNYQRLDVGSYGPGSNIRLRRSLRFFPWNGDSLGLREVFRGLGRLRNQLMGLEADLWSRPQPGDAIYDTPHVAQYPLGGGFISPHVDRLKSHITRHLPGFKETHVVALILSERGVDFQSGGGWVLDPSGQKIDWEGAVALGDLVVYNGLARHGVDPVDQTAPLDMDHFTGRLFGLVSLYPSRTLAPIQEKIAEA